MGAASGVRPVALVGAYALATLTGLAAASGRPPVRSLAELRQERVVIQEWDTSCGAAALATLLTHDLRDPVSEREIAISMLGRTDAHKVRIQGGFSLLDLQRFAVTRGYTADGYGELTLETLESMLPAIVPVSFHGYDHFVVVRRFHRGQAVLADPAYGMRKLPLHRFDRAWKLKVAFVVRREG